MILKGGRIESNFYFYRVETRTFQVPKQNVERNKDIKISTIRLINLIRCIFLLLNIFASEKSTAEKAVVVSFSLSIT